MAVFIALIMALTSSTCFGEFLYDDHKDLSRAKYYLIIGNYEMARVALNSDLNQNLTGDLKATKMRYESIIEFNDKNFTKAYALLKTPELNSRKNKLRTCSQRIILSIIFDQKKDLLETWPECIRNEGMSPFWAEKIVQMYIDKGPHKIIKEMNEIMVDKIDLEMAKNYLKLSLFIQQENLFLDRLREFPQEFFNDKEMREIVGMLYYRTGQLYKAFDFIEDLSYTNAENIKGDLFMLQEKYEIAFPQFKLVWANRFNSTEALLRSFPISWLIKEWEDGLNILYKIPDKYIDDDPKAFFQSLFSAALNKQKEAWKILEKIPYDSTIFKIYEVRELQSHLALFETPKSVSKYYAEKSCYHYNPIHCWIFKQHDYWEDLGSTLKRNETIIPEAEKQLAELMDPKNVKLSEEVVIDQKYIEELDRADFLN